ncbi:MAG: dockerin type I repeat-containing protein, partial [Ruminococcus sp.]|nr:dockerin type I repeat-containing protein [Ruminococcus sp.]
GTPGYLSRTSYDLLTDIKLTANAPVAGKSPETALTTNSEGISKVSSVKWYDGSKELTDKDKFTAGKTYTAKFTLAPFESHMFTEDTKVTVNGVEAKPTSDNFSREVEYTVNFKAKEPASSADSKSSSKSGTSSAPKKDSSSKPESKSDNSSKKSDDTSKPDDKKIIKGDADLDGSINVTDIAMIASHIKGIKALEGDGLANADVNDDEKVNVTDIAMIAAHIKGIKPLV